jgi:hypothetical protein
VKFEQEVNMHATGEMFILALVAIVFLGTVALVSILLSQRHAEGNVSTPPSASPPPAPLVVPPANLPAQEAVNNLRNEIVKEVTNNLKTELEKQYEQSRISSWVSVGAVGVSVGLLGISLWIQATAGSLTKLIDAVFLVVLGLYYLTWAIRMQAKQRREYRDKWGTPPRP